MVSRTGSANSPTASSATSSPSSHPRTAPARRCSPPAGVPYGAPLLSTSTSALCCPTTSASPSVRSRASFHRTRARAAASPSPQCTCGATPPRPRPWKVGSGPPLSTTSKSLRSTTAVVHMGRSRRRCRYRCAASRPLFTLPTSAAAVDSRMEAAMPACYFTCRFSSSSAFWMSQSQRAPYDPYSLAFMLSYDINCSRVRIASPTIRSIFVVMSLRCGSVCEQIIVEEAPCLERLVLFAHLKYNMEMVVTVISAPKLHVLGLLSVQNPVLELESTIFQGSRLVSSMTVRPTVKILALTQSHLSLDAVIDIMRCFTCLETLYIKTTMAGETNVWSRKYRDLLRTIDISLKKIVLIDYRGNKSHVNFAKFFILNARLLESMVFQIYCRPKHSEKDYCRVRTTTEWIEDQHKLLQTKNKASSCTV